MLSSRTLLGSFLALSLAAPAALAQQEFFLYPCDATVGGTIIGEAGFFAAGVGGSSDQDSASLAGTFTPPGGYPFAFGARVAVEAEAIRSITQSCCTSEVGAVVGGGTRYGYTGEEYWMSFATSSSRSHRAFVTRGAAHCDAEDYVWADSAYYMPHSDNYRADIPFIVGGGNNAVMVVTDFILSRTDTGPSGGYTYLFWEIVADENANCVADWDEPWVASGWGSVGPNERVQVPDIRFDIPRGYYILRIWHRPMSYLGVFSPTCEVDEAASSGVTDSCQVRFELH